MCASTSDRHFQFSQRAGEDSTSSVQKREGGGGGCFSEMVTGMINVMIHVQFRNCASLRTSYSQSSDEIIPSTGTLRGNHEFTHLMCRKKICFSNEILFENSFEMNPSTLFFSHLLMA